MQLDLPLFEQTEDINTDQLYGLVMLMKDPKKGLEISNRSSFFKKYRQCFSADDAMKWFIKELKVNSEQAKFIGNMLISRNMMHHVTDPTKRFSDCIGSVELFRFQCDEIGPLNWKVIWTEPVSDNPCILAEDLLKQILNLLKGTNLSDTKKILELVKSNSWIHFEFGVSKFQKLISR
eukprot:TRINITY_DN8462_c0_g1_i2.p1 TRINITY_DN8462_c0_g1~~TRINITY_DN8462_c0_g1_i2.p1  ORF type:complete len:178 (+),score=14.32 TRINITY_DN8462_c0_g1_i2:41-574(+)